jgi:hypothetical protein
MLIIFDTRTYHILHSTLRQLRSNASCAFIYSTIRHGLIAGAKTNKLTIIEDGPDSI